MVRGDQFVCGPDIRQGEPWGGGIAGAEAAAFGHEGERWDGSFDGGEPRAGNAVESRDTGEEAFGVGVAWVCEEGGGGGAFCDAAAVHDDDFVAHFGDDPEVVGDEEDGHAAFRLDFADEVEDLGLDGDVEGGGGFVCDEQGRFEGEGEGDDDALAHAAAELVGVFRVADFGGGDADAAEDLDGAVARLAGRAFFVEEEDLAELAADGLDWVEGRHGFLEDHAHAAAAERPEPFLRGGGEVFVFEEDGTAGDDARGVGQEAHDGHGRHAFAAA